jgi:quinol monooxygenase YgiN
MKPKVRFTVELDVADGKLDEFERITRTMAARTKAEPGAIEYDFYISDDRKRCRLLEAYSDADAVLAHLKGPVVQELVPQMLAALSAAIYNRLHATV